MGDYKFQKLGLAQAAVAEGENSRATGSSLSLRPTCSSRPTSPVSVPYIPRLFI